MRRRLERTYITRKHAQTVPPEDGHVPLDVNQPTDTVQVESQSQSTRTAVIGIAILCSLVVFFLVTYFLFRYFRKTYAEPPPWLPKFLKKRWKKWPSAPTASTAYSRARLEDIDGPPQSGVDRTTSVRSIMTLPEYRAIANPDKERTIAREGERGGMDIVVESPETQDEEEARREQHMQTLYEIRVARTADREERRARREARRRGERLPSNSSVARLRTPSGSAPPQTLGGGVSSLLNVEAGDSPRSSTPAISSRVQEVLASRSASTLAALIAEPKARLPQVTYADIGVARPDGSRVRESSASSDQRVLLGDAATMGNSHSRQNSSGSINTIPYNHSHARSASALSSMTSATANLNTSTPSIARTTRRGSSDSFQFVQLHGHRRQSSDLTDMRTDPPEYDRLQFEEAPPYESPVGTRLELPPLTPAGTRRSSRGPSSNITSRNTVAGGQGYPMPYGNGGI
ncbi:hypothetical protein BGX38DRAFT_1268938 [Terfezia claveryi]|nr:hypothetical protein BGX38DRAFT_1268938 [Terfezia claveryi]